MKKNKINLSREQLEEAIQLFNRSMDDYLYLFDIQNDYYSISKHAVNRFCLPNYHFCDATKAHNYFVYEDDLPLLFDEFNKIKSGEITEHSLHYRWLDRQHNPVWIDCRGDVILDEFNKTGAISFINSAGTQMFIYHDNFKHSKITIFTHISD